MLRKVRHCSDGGYARHGPINRKHKVGIESSGLWCAVVKYRHCAFSATRVTHMPERAGFRYTIFVPSYQKGYISQSSTIAD